MSAPPRAPRVTVVITTHNRPEHARVAVASALAQTIPDVEVVVVDDGSAPPFTAPTDDPRVRMLRREPAGGMCAARNHGLAVASGAWVTFLDDDDELAPEMLERALAAASTSSLPAPVAVMTAMTVVDADGAERDRCHPPTLRRGAHYLLEGGVDARAKNGLVAPTDVVRAIGGWDEQFEAFESDDFGLRLNRVASIEGLDEPLYRLTHHDAPRLTRRSHAIPRDMARTLAKHAEVFGQHRSAHARYLSTLGMYELRAGHWGAAIHWCGRGVERDPRRARNWWFLAAALAGPHLLHTYRRLRPREATVSFAELTRRRVRKYAKRFARGPHALVAAAPAVVTRAVHERRRGVLDVDRPRAVLVLCVYRAANAPAMRPLVDEAQRRGWAVRLWALDQAAPGLAASTVGVSVGAKFPLLNRLLDGVDLDGFDWVVIADDDVAFRGGSVAELLAVAESAALDLVQPAHTEVSHRDNEIAVRRAFSVARRTTFVEIGPIFAVARGMVHDVLPFPLEHAMGWGLELEWFDLARRGARLGIVDLVPIRHLHPVGAGYAKRAEAERLNERVHARGLGSFDDIQQTLATWRPWEVRPPWDGGPVESPTSVPTEDLP